MRMVMEAVRRLPMPMPMPVLAMLMMLALLAGCGGLRSDTEPDRIYVLHPAVDAAPAAPLPGLLMVPRPAVQPGLDTDRIALTRAGNELDYYALSRWSGSLSQVLGAFAVQSLAGAFVTVVGAERGAGPADHELLLTVRHFQAAYGAGGAPQVQVAIDCLLVATSPRRVLGNCDAEVREPVGDNRMSAIVAAFERAMQQAMQQVRARVVAAAG